MIIQLNTDKNIQGDEALATHVEGVVSHALERFGGQVSRVEVHLSDLNAGKSGAGDKHCTMEARLDGRPPAAVSHNADQVRDAISGAVHKLQRLLDSSLGKLAAPERNRRDATRAADMDVSPEPTADVSSADESVPDERASDERVSDELIPDGSVR